ncbi:MAG: alkaline phosphatase D family protein [Terriglobia bacterium]
MRKRIDRRSFLKESGSAAIGVTAASLLGASRGRAATGQSSFRSAWPKDAERPWAGPEYWTNPLEDWRIRNGRLECFVAGGDRNVFLLTHEIAARNGSLGMSVRTGPLGSEEQKLGDGCVGFRVGIKSFLDDYRTWAIHGRGMNIGVSGDGRLFIGELQESAPRVEIKQELQLDLSANPAGDGRYRATLRASTAKGRRLTEVTREVPGEWLTGGIALVASSGKVEPTPQPLGELTGFEFYPPHQERGGTIRFWFSDFAVSGDKVDAHPERAFGPILFTFYTLSRGTLKLSAQLPPLGNAPKQVALQVRNGNGRWKTVANSDLDPDAWNGLFRVPSWDDTKDHAYRVLYAMPDSTGIMQKHTYTGTIRKDPKDGGNLTVGLNTCIWDMGFPHSDLTRNIAYHKPDILLWTGDQVYEPNGGFGVMETRDPELLVPSMLDYLRKWYLFGWAVRDLTRDIPSVCMTDDHDMFHGNIWGCGGRPAPIPPGLPLTSDDADDLGGYKMPARWVNMAQRAQTSHLPDPFDPTPVLQGITVYYTDLRWGGVSFAILEDRKWKSAPTIEVPEAHIANGFPRDPHWDCRKSDVPTAELLGQRQLDFLEYWAADWGRGAWMKFAVSQTRFGCLATEPMGDDNDDYDSTLPFLPVGAYAPNDWLMADHDSNGWPQHGRNAAIRKWRKAFAMHLSGDQHLGATSHYGVDDFRDGVYGTCTPALSNIWPRRWFPPHKAPNGLPGTRNTGDYLDRFWNHLTVFGAANPHLYPGEGLAGLRHRATGYSILRCNRATREIRIEMWPRWVDPSQPGAKPYDGWPITIHQLDNGLYNARYTLGEIKTPGHRDPVIQVQEARSGDVVYTVRAEGESFTPRVRELGAYTVIAFDPDSGYRRAWKGINAQRVQNGSDDES